jgi:uncharacterized protein
MGKAPGGKKDEIENIINIVTERFTIKVRLNDTKTAKKLLKILPAYSRINKWGDEIYFSIPMKAEIENGVEVVEIGTVAFWPPGSALCIFFGRTPASISDKPQAASPVTVIGSVIDEESIKNLKGIKDGEEVKIR